jgi:predicted O-methyltransferase YrrM
MEASSRADGAAIGAAIGRAERFCSPEPAFLSELRAETRKKWPGGAHMVSGVQQGRLLHTLVKLARAERVLEVGCFTGYAAAWMALALPPGGRLVTLEKDERAAEVALRHLDAAGIGSRVELRLGDAMETLAKLDPAEAPFDLIFLDADKKRTIEY